MLLKPDAQNNPLERLTERDYAEIWQEAHRAWLNGGVFLDNPQAFIAKCYAIAVVNFLKRKKDDSYKAN